MGFDYKTKNPGNGRILEDFKENWVYLSGFLKEQNCSSGEDLSPQETESKPLTHICGDGEKQDRSWEMEHAIRQIVSGAIVPGQVIDIFSAAGLQKPDISILSEEFLAEVRGLPQKNVAVESVAQTPE